MNLEALPLSGMVGSLARGLAEAQAAVDLAGVRVAEAMSRSRLEFDGETVSMLELGFSPTFYQFTDTRIELRVSVSVSREQSAEQGAAQHDRVASFTSRVSSVDARFASRFQYNAQGSSILSTRLLPVPAPDALMTRAHALAAEGGAA